MGLTLPADFQVPEFVWLAVAGLCYGIIEYLKWVRTGRIVKKTQETNQVVLEVKETAAQTQTDMAETKQKVERVEQRVAMNPPAHPRILVVDDDVRFCQFLKDELTLRGYVVQSVGTGKGAIEQ